MDRSIDGEGAEFREEAPGRAGVSGAGERGLRGERPDVFEVEEEEAGNVGVKVLCEGMAGVGTVVMYPSCTAAEAGRGGVEGVVTEVNGRCAALRWERRGGGEGLG